MGEITFQNPHGYRLAEARLFAFSGDTVPPSPKTDLFQSMKNQPLSLAPIGFQAVLPESSKLFRLLGVSGGSRNSCLRSCRPGVLTLALARMGCLPIVTDGSGNTRPVVSERSCKTAFDFRGAARLPERSAAREHRTASRAAFRMRNTFAGRRPS